MKLTFCYRHLAHYHHAQLNALVEGGVDVTVITFDDFSGAAFDNHANEEKKYLLLQLSNSSGEWDGFFQRLEESRPDVVLVPGWGHAYALVALDWATRHQVPCVAISDSQECDQSRNFIMEKIKKSLVSLFSAGFVAGQRSRDYIVKLGMPVEQITIGCDVVDNDYFIRRVEQARKSSEKIRQSKGLPENYFLVVSRLIPVKNIATVIKAYAIYSSSGDAPDDWSLVIVGAGSLQPELEQLALKLGVDSSIIFVGRVSYENIPDYYALASAFILASTSEPWGLVVNEAMCAGLPVLVSDLCGSSADLLKENVNGFKFSPDDENLLAMKMKDISSGSVNITTMGESSREIIDEWALDRYVDNIKKVAEIALSNPRGKPTMNGRLLLSMVIKWLDKKGAVR